jgi:RNA polymerase sigma factor (sigma-70 family)
VTEDVAITLEPPPGHTGPVALPVPVIDDYAELFRSQYPRLVRALELGGASRWQAEDMAQEAFARTLVHWRRVRAGTNPAGYLYRVAFRLMTKLGLLDGETAAPVSSPGADATATLRVDLHRALAHLPPRRRACVILVWLLDLTTADAGEALSISPGTVRKHLELARTQLATELV